jgi:hypothetical protein
MLISRIVWLIWGSLMRAFDSFMISVDFCSEPVTLTIATRYREAFETTRITVTAYPFVVIIAFLWTQVLLCSQIVGPFAYCSSQLPGLGYGPT